MPDFYDTGSLPRELDPQEPIEDSWQGITGERRILCEWKDREIYAPPKGELYPGYTTLRCASRQFFGKGAGVSGSSNWPHQYCEIVCKYAEYTALDSDLKWRWQPASKLLSTGIGRTWRNGGFLNEDQPIAVLCTMSHGSCRKTLGTEPTSLVAAAENCINAGWWRPTPNSPRFAPETMLFLGADVEEWWDKERGRYLYGVTYNFLRQPFSHNVLWREPLPAFDDNGFVTGIAVPGDWDYLDPVSYKRWDFNPMMGLPALVYPYGSSLDASEAATGVGGEFRLT